MQWLLFCTPQQQTFTHCRVVWTGTGTGTGSNRRTSAFRRTLAPSELPGRQRQSHTQPAGVVFNPQAARMAVLERTRGCKTAAAGWQPMCSSEVRLARYPGEFVRGGWSTTAIVRERLMLRMLIHGHNALTDLAATRIKGWCLSCPACSALSPQSRDGWTRGEQSQRTLDAGLPTHHDIPDERHTAHEQKCGIGFLESPQPHPASRAFPPTSSWRRR